MCLDRLGLLGTESVGLKEGRLLTELEGGLLWFLGLGRVCILFGVGHLKEKVVFIFPAPVVAGLLDQTVHRTKLACLLPLLHLLPRFAGI
jgi:hypothetical protein